MSITTFPSRQLNKMVATEADKLRPAFAAPDSAPEHDEDGALVGEDGPDDSAGEDEAGARARGFSGSVDGGT